MVQLLVLGTYLLPIRILSATGVPVAGVTFDQVNILSTANDGGNLNYTPPDAAHWNELLPYGAGAYTIFIDNNYWLTTGVFSGGDGMFYSGDVVTGSLSSATGTVNAGPLTTGPIPLSIGTVTGAFITGDVVTSSSGTTATLTAPQSNLFIPNSPGPLEMIVSPVTPGAWNYFVGVFDVVGALVAQVLSVIGSPATGTVGGAIAAVQTTVNAIQTSIGVDHQAIADIHNMEFGRWEIFTTGADSNRLVAYRTGGTIAIGTIVGTFTAGEVVKDTTSGASGTVVFTTGVTPLTLIDTVGTFTSGDALVGQTSGATATATSGITSINSNVLQKFNLFDSGGSPVTTNPFERLPTP